MESSDVKTMLNPVLAYLPRERLDPIEQLILYHVYVLSRERGGEWIRWSDVLLRLGLPRRKADEARDRLAARGLIEAVKQGNRWLLRYKHGLFAGLRSVAPGDEGWKLAVTAVLYYLEHGYYVVPARQDPGLSARPDLVAIPFDKASLSLRYSRAVAVEIESCNEINTHPEQVTRNIEKHGSTPFAEVHVWLPKRCLAEAQRPLAAARKPKPVKLYPVTFTGRRAVLLDAALEEIRGGASDGAEADAGGVPVEAEASGDASGAASPAPAASGVEEGAGGEEPGAVGRGGHVEAGAGSAGEPADRVGAGSGRLEAPGDSSLRRLLEAQAELLAALGKAQARLLEAQRAASEKLDRLLEAVGRMNELLERQTRLLERLIGGQQREGQHETETPGETPETREPQNCVEIQLDEPPGQTACLPPRTAALANQYRKQGYRLTQTPTGRIYATRRNRRIPLY